MPAWSRRSYRDPFSTQMPTVTEGTPGMASLRDPHAVVEARAGHIEAISGMRGAGGCSAAPVLRRRFLAAEADLARLSTSRTLTVDLVAFLEHVATPCARARSRAGRCAAGRRSRAGSRRRRRSRRSSAPSRRSCPTSASAVMPWMISMAFCIAAPSAGGDRAPCRRPRRRSCTPVSSMMPRMILPPGPMTSRILSGLILMVMMRGA